jgi:triacylglycerol lipase
MTAERKPVLLVHGYLDTSKIFRHMRAFLEEEGREVHCVNLVPNNGSIGLDDLARQVAAYAAGIEASFDLIGFSMGGMVSRYYVQRLGGAKRVRRFITISSPHRGTYIAFARQSVGVRQMRPGSTFLRDLDRDCESLQSLDFTSIWTPFDLMIVPANSSVIGAARCVRVNVALHPLMVSDRRVLRLVGNLLSGSC